MPYLLCPQRSPRAPSLKRGLGLLQLFLGHHHKPPPVARAQEPTVPSHGIVHRDDVALLALVSNVIDQVVRKGQKMHVPFASKRSIWAEKLHCFVFADMIQCILKVTAGWIRVVQSEGKIMAQTHRAKAMHSMERMEGKSMRMGTASR